MKTTKKENPCRVSDRAYRTIISDVIDSMTGCKIDPFTFKQVVTAVRHYLTDGKITGLGKKAKQGTSRNHGACNNGKVLNLRYENQ